MRPDVYAIPRVSSPRLVRPSASFFDRLVPVPGRDEARAAAVHWGVSETEAAIALGLVTPWRLVLAVAAETGARATRLSAQRYRLIGEPSTWRECLARQSASVVDEEGRPFIVLSVDAARLDVFLVRRARIAAHGASILLAPRADFERFLREAGRADWVDGAVHGLAREEPADSASDPRTMKSAGVAAIGLVVALAAGKLLAPTGIALAIGGTATVLCFLWLAFRLIALATPVSPLSRRPLSDRDLPVYTILCPLHREADSVPDLIAALSALDYPRAKLDVKFLVEADDLATLQAFDRVGVPPWAEVIPAPPCLPRTKPKALMLGLPFARGSLVVVYDAEDRPEPGQLREAAETFAAAGPRLGCLQAPLAIELDRHGRRPGLRDYFFAAEYEGIFRVLVPALARWRAPIPLGGSSNHFRGVM